MAESPAAISVQFEGDLTSLDGFLSQAQSRLSAASQKMDARASRTLQKTINEQSKAIADAYARVGEARAMAFDMRAFNLDDTREVTKSFYGAGERSSAEFANGFGGGGGSLSRKLAGGALKFAIVGAADSLIRGLAEGVKTAKSWDDVAMSMAEGLANGLRNVPLVGGVYELSAAFSERFIVPAIGRLADEGGSDRGMGGRFAAQAAMMQQIDDAINAANIDAMSPSDARLARFNQEMKAMRTQAESAGVDMGRFDEKAAKLREATMAEIEKMRAAESEKQAAEDARKADEENDRQLRYQQSMDALREKQKADADAAWKDVTRWNIGQKRGQLEIAQAMLGAVPNVSASSFVNTATTAIGGYRMGQADTGQIIAENTRKAAEINEQIRRLLGSIYDLEKQSNAGALY